MDNQASERPMRQCRPGRKLLVVQNPGKLSRNYLTGIVAALGRMGIGHCVLELGEVWAANKSDPAGLVQRLSHVLVQQHVGAVLAYGFNGAADVPLDGGVLGTMRSFFEIRQVPHLMLWIDHPQWHADLIGLRPEMQGIFRSGNSVHFLKCGAHALEMERMLGWPNCFALAPGVDPAQFPPRGELAGGQAEYDLVAIFTDKGAMPAWLKDFMGQDDPDPAAIRAVILEEVCGALDKLWQAEAPAAMRPELTALGRKWAGKKAEAPFLAAMRHWPALLEEFPGACWYLAMAYPTYMKAVSLLWRLRAWERKFYVGYLARTFKVGVFGGDWSALGLGPGGWIDYTQQSAVYGRGKVALALADGHDEEGLILRPFEIAASGVPMLHYRAEGLAECFEPGREVEVFERPAEAREKLAGLLADAGRRREMASAARERVLRQHTWEQRIARMLALARLPADAFRP